MTPAVASPAKKDSPLPGLEGEHPPTGWTAHIAVIALLLLALASPWPFGSAHPLAVSVIMLLALGAAFVTSLAEAWHGRLVLPSAPLWPLAGFLLLGAFQLLPLPPSLHSALAPGSWTIWRPAEPAAAAILGPAWRPVSVFPAATERGLGVTLGLVALGALAGPALSDRRRVLRVVLVLGGGGLLVALYGVVARTLFGSLLYGVFVVPTVAPFGPFVSKNHFAGYVEMTTLLILGLALGLADEARRGPSLLSWTQSRRAGRVVVAFGVAATMVLAVLVSLSRGGAVSLASGVTAFAILRIWARRRIPSGGRIAGTVGVLAAVVFVSFAVLPQEGRDRVLSLAGITSDQSGAFRLGVWRDTLRLAGSSPIVGQGLGAYEDALPPFKTTAGELRVEHAESDYLETLAECGGLGLFLALAVVFLLLRSALTRIRREEDRLRRGIGLGAAAGVVALLVHGTFDFNLRIPSNAILFAFLLTLAVAEGPGPARTVPSFQSSTIARPMPWAGGAWDGSGSARVAREKPSNSCIAPPPSTRPARSCGRASPC
jgi:O-antigen ligase